MTNLFIQFYKSLLKSDFFLCVLFFVLFIYFNIKLNKISKEVLNFEINLN